MSTTHFGLQADGSYAKRFSFLDLLVYFFPGFSYFQKLEVEIKTFSVGYIR